MGTCPRSTRMMFAAAVMHPVIASLLVRAVEKARKARAEIVKMLQGFGCEQVGFMDNFDDCSVCCWRSRIAVVRCSFAHRLLGGDVPQEKPVVVAAPGVEAAMGAGRARSEADRGQLDPARLGPKGQIAAIETGILRGCNRLLTVFHLGSTTMKARLAGIQGPISGPLSFT
jgi:hypothetical protein